MITTVQSGMTALDIAREENYADIVQILTNPPDPSTNQVSLQL